MNTPTNPNNRIEQHLSMDVSVFSDIIQKYNSIKDSINEDDYVKTIFINACKSHYLGESYEQYLNYECNISTPLDYHKKLIDDGYLMIAPLEEQIDANFKVTDIKDILKKNGLKVSGKKEELIKRMIDEIGVEAINKLMTKKLAVISKKGEDWLSEHVDYLLLRKLGQSASWKLHTFVKQCYRYDFYDTAIVTKLINISEGSSQELPAASIVNDLLHDFYSIFTVDRYTPIPTSIDDDYTRHRHDVMFVLIRLLYIDICNILPNVVRNENFWEFNQFHVFDKYIEFTRIKEQRSDISATVERMYLCLDKTPFVQQKHLLKIVNDISSIEISDNDIQSKLDKIDNNTWKSQNAKNTQAIIKDELEYNKMKEILKCGIIEIANKLTLNLKKSISSHPESDNISQETFSILKQFNWLNKVVDSQISRTQIHHEISQPSLSHLNSNKTNLPRTDSKATKTKKTIAIAIVAILLVIILFQFI